MKRGIDKTLVDRWDTVDGLALTRQIFKRLASGRSLKRLGIAVHDGRLDLRGLSAPATEVGPPRQAAGLTYRQLHGLTEVRGCKLKGVDFSGAMLRDLRFFDSSFTDCRFDGADCREWRMWGCDVQRCSFRSADLRDASIGAWSKGRFMRWSEVDFSGADMRRIVASEAVFAGCEFANARLEHIDFGSVFAGCHFAGHLREVQFYDRAFDSHQREPNRMLDCDFSEALLDWVAFRRLDLDHVKLPSGPEHLVVGHYRCVLERALELLDGASEPWQLGLRGMLENQLKWCGPNRAVGVFFKANLGETPAQIEQAIELLKSCESECRSSEGG